MKNRILARLLVLTAFLAVANGDLYPFMPFGLFGCIALLFVAGWLSRENLRNQPEESRRNNIRFSVIYAAILFCFVFGMKVDIDIKVIHRLFVNAVIATAFIIVTILDLTDKKANKSFEHIRQPGGCLDAQR